MTHNAKKYGLMIIAAVLLVALLFAGAASADASGNCGKGGAANLQWTFFDSTKTLVITGSGEMGDYTDDGMPWVANRSSITSVTLPSGLKNIGNHAFDTSWLTSIEIPASVEKIGEKAFYNCGSLTEVTFESGSQLKTIGQQAFDLCTALTRIEIPASVTTIYLKAFNTCKALTEITFESGSKLKTIGQEAFQECDALKSIEIPASVTTIDLGAFYECGALKTVTFAEGSKLKTIGRQAFGNTGLRCITIPASVETIGQQAFCKEGGSDLTEVTFADVSKLATIANYALTSSGLKKVILKKGTFTSGVVIEEYVFYDCSDFSTVISDVLQTPEVMGKFVVSDESGVDEDIKPVWYISDIKAASALLPEGYNDYSIGLLNGGTLKANFVQQKDASGNYTLPTANDVTRAGYAFDKWVNNGDEVTTLTESCKNATLMWDIITYKITYELNGGKNHADNPDTYTVEDDEIILQDATREGYTFGGWYEDESFTKEITKIAKGSTGDMKLYAKWTPIANRGHSASIPKDYTPSSSVPVMVQETAKPTATPTVAAPTMMPTTKATSSTSKSPAPFAGLIAGLGAAALLVRMRK